MSVLCASDDAPAWDARPRGGRSVARCELTRRPHLRTSLDSRRTPACLYAATQRGHHTDGTDAPSHSYVRTPTRASCGSYGRPPRSRASALTSRPGVGCAAVLGSYRMSTWRRAAYRLRRAAVWTTRERSGDSAEATVRGVLGRRPSRRAASTRARVHTRETRRVSCGKRASNTGARALLTVEETVHTSSRADWLGKRYVSANVSERGC